MEKILNAQNMQMHLLDKKFFKLTLETFKQSFLKSDNMSQELMDKFLGLVEKIQTDNQLNTFDLPDCAAEVRRLVKKKEHDDKLATSSSSSQKNTVNSAKSETHKQRSTQNKQENRQTSTRTHPTSTQKSKTTSKNGITINCIFCIDVFIFDSISNFDRTYYNLVSFSFLFN